YNRATRIVEAIRSVKAQNYPAIQLIVADDGSTDNTVEIIKQFDDIEYFYQENRGQGAARNLGLKHAKGEYIASLDSDDIWNEDFLTVAVRALEHYQADFVFLNWKEIFENEILMNGWEKSQKWKKYYKNLDDDWSFLNGKQVRQLFLTTCPAPSSALLIRRSSLVVPWNEEMKIADDWCLILEMVLSKSCRSAFTLSHYWTKYIHAGNIYHGRDLVEVIKDLGLHDEPLIAKRFQKQLTIAEKAILQKRLAGHYLNFSRLNLKKDGFSMKHIGTIATAFKLTPLGSIFYIMQLSYYFLRKQFRAVEDK
ncbi:MAG: glycosyltransferase family 2 protein, partial [Pyrinomonadaceae bacterium]